MLTLTVRCLHEKVDADLINLPTLIVACPSSPGDGGTSSTLAYLTKVASFGFEASIKAERDYYLSKRNSVFLYN